MVSTLVRNESGVDLIFTLGKVFRIFMTRILSKLCAAWLLNIPSVGTVMVMTTGSLGGVMVSTLVQNAIDVGSIPTLGAVFPIFVSPHDIGAVTRILYKLCTVWLLNLPCVFIHIYIYIYIYI